MVHSMVEFEAPSSDTIKKFEIEAALRTEAVSGTLKEDNPLSASEDFRQLCEACRRGDLRTCQEKIQEGVNIHARDHFDYTPLILASLCGHYEVCQLLIERGALCERDTFQGERAVYNALNDRIRNLLLSYDYSKSRDPLQPLAGHITTLLHRPQPHTSDITIVTEEKDFKLHKFVLAARSPYFAKKLKAAPDTTTWRIPNSIPSRSLEIAIQALYFMEISLDFSGSAYDQAILAGIGKLGRQLEIGDLLDAILESDRRKARQRRSAEVERGRDQLDAWFQTNVVQNQVHVDKDRAAAVQWSRQNSIFADVLLCATEDDDEEETTESYPLSRPIISNAGPTIPVGPTSAISSTPTSITKRATLIPTHRAMLIRSDYFLAMFTSPFREAQPSTHLPVVNVDCAPSVLLIILSYLYTETSNIPLSLAIPTLFAADMFFIDKLKANAATVISTLGNGTSSVVEAKHARGEIDECKEVDIYDIIRAGWFTKVRRLEEFGARFIAYRLERYIGEEDFKELVKESAERIRGRQETDTVELIDDIRYCLSDRFRLRFEDVGFDELNQQGLDGEGSDAVENHIPLEGVVRTLDGEIAGDEFAQDALNYQILLGKIDALLEGLELDA